MKKRVIELERRLADAERRLANLEARPLQAPQPIIIQPVETSPSIPQWPQWPSYPLITCSSDVSN